MQTNVYIGNKGGYRCYGCSVVVRNTDIFSFPGLSHPNNWLCSSCLHDRLQNGTLSLSSPEGGVVSDVRCSNCADDIPEGDVVVCTGCHEAAQENHDYCHDDDVSTCDNCGDDDDVYCKTCAKDIWDLTEPNDYQCDECSTNGTVDEPLVNLCAKCHDKAAAAVATAEAADHLDVSW